MNRALLLVGLFALGCGGDSASSSLDSTSIPLAAKSDVEIEPATHFARTEVTTERPVVGSGYPTTGMEMWDPLPQTAFDERPSEVGAPLSDQEKSMVISAVRQHLFDGEAETKEVEYTIRRMEAGYSVFVQFSNAPGGHCFVELDHKGKVVGLVGGA
jgi:hypothetical protein